MCADSVWAAGVRDRPFVQRVGRDWAEGSFARGLVAWLRCPVGRARPAKVLRTRHTLRPAPSFLDTFAVGARLGVVVCWWWYSRWVDEYGIRGELCVSASDPRAWGGSVDGNGNGSGANLVV